MRYRIGDIVSLMGLSREAIRSYENVGIIDPQRNPESGYRYYGLTDLGALIRVRRYRAYGFTLKESAQLLNHCDAQQVHGMAEERAVQLEKEIAQQQLYLNCLKQWTDKVAAIDEQIGNFALVQSPAMYVLQLTENNRLVNQKGMRDRLRTWVENEPIVFSCGIWRMEGDKRTPREPTMYLGVLEQDVPSLNLSVEPPVVYWPSRLCIHTIVVRSESAPTQEAQLLPALDHLKKHGYTLQGDPFIRTLLLTHKNTDSRVYRDLWLPIEKPQSS